MNVPTDRQSATPGVADATIFVRPDGPYIVTGDFTLSAPGAPRDASSVVLCRCGRSANKPYCDGAHRRVGFVDAGAVAALPLPQGASRTARLTILPTRDGPFQCTGPLALRSCGVTHPMRDVSLCRCGASATKPFCDGSHAGAGFVG